VPSGVREGTFAEQLLNNRLQTGGLHNWELRNANKTNENRSVQTGQGELASRRQDLELPEFNQRMRKQLRGTAKRELSLA
jgi:hypothetical protein